MLPTGQIFGHLNQKGPNKRRAAGQILADFVQKVPKRGQTSGKFVFLLFFSLILGKSKKYFNVPTDTDQEIFFLQ